MSTEPIVEEAAGLCVNEHGGAIGMPQLCGEWIPNQIFWLLVTLVVIYFVLTKIALPRIAAVLADRKGTITNDLAAAEELKQKADLRIRLRKAGAGGDGDGGKNYGQKARH